MQNENSKIIWLGEEITHDLRQDHVHDAHRDDMMPLDHPWRKAFFQINEEIRKIVNNLRVEGIIILKGFLNFFEILRNFSN